MTSSDRHVGIIGAGIGGLSAAVDLSRRGFRVSVFEAARAPGGKVRKVTAGGRAIDAGPTVFTLRDVFESLFADAGASLDATLRLKPAEVLARHAWSADERLDLFADVDRSADTISAFASPAEGRNYIRFLEDAKRIHDTLDHSFMRAEKPSVAGLVKRAGVPGLMGIRSFATLWKTLGTYFGDPRLQQLFGRYATYCGASPFACPATLMLIAYVEQSGVWLIDGGLPALARALQDLAESHGATFRFSAPVSEIRHAGGRATGLRLKDGTEIDCDAVVLNADTNALASGLFGAAVRSAVPATKPSERSLSALTWIMTGRARGFPLLHHSVFFSRDYKAEFDDILMRRRLPREPTVYICAQDRPAADAPCDARSEETPERFLFIMNAPPTGDTHPLPPEEIAACETHILALLSRCGLTLDFDPADRQIVGPAEFDRLFPATGGALYGRASHGWRASFERPGATTRLPGLYLAGGSAHPGAGVPMAAISGRLAAQRIATDLTSR